MFNLAISGKYISTKMHSYCRKLAGSTNASGDTQIAMDVESDKVIEDRLKELGIVREYASEEQDEIKTFSKAAKYSVAVDPLDGSSLMNVNLAIGTIAVIHEGGILTDNKIVGAMYILYGPLTTLVYSVGNGVHEFVLNPEGEFVLATENITLKEKGKIYSSGGLRSTWTPQHKQFIEYLESNNYKLRYSGAFVADMNQILMKGGGVFTYPALTTDPNGKLRLESELRCMAYLITNAGGLATNGTKNILDLAPTQLHARSPIYIGSKEEVQKAGELLRGDA